MNAAKKDITTTDAYIRSFPKDMQTILEKIRQIIRKAAPETTETMSYNMPTFKLNGRYLIYFAGWKNHISLYPIPTSSGAFNKQVSQYIAGKGTIKFLLDKPIPYDLVKKNRYGEHEGKWRKEKYSLLRQISCREFTFFCYYYPITN